MINTFVKNQLVSDLMTKNMLTAGLNDTVGEIESVMEGSEIHHIPVINDNYELQGIISKVDIQVLKHWGTKFELKEAAVQNKGILDSMLAKDIMQKNCVTVAPDQSLSYCADLFKQNKFRALPVVEDNKLKGIITTYDLLVAAYQ